MTQFLSLSGQRVVTGSISIPLYGAWSGDVQISGSDPIPDNGPLVMGNLTLAANIYRQAVFGGTRMCRLVGGFGGWRKTLPAKQYAQASGVQLALVLGDAALESGEKVSVPNDRVIGTDYVRESAPASNVLRELAGSAWHIEPSGVTKVAPWATTKVPSAFTAINQEGAPGRVEIATESYLDWMPGCTFTAPNLEGTFTNRGAMFKFDAEGQFRLLVLTQ